MCPTVRQRTRHSSSRHVLRSQRHHDQRHHHQRHNHQRHHDQRHNHQRHNHQRHHHQRMGHFFIVWKRPLTNEELYYKVAVFNRYDNNGEESTPTAQKGLLRPEKGGKLRRSQCLETRHACSTSALRGPRI